jgi:hypothetical protein
MSDRVSNGVIIAVSIVWTLGQLVDLFNITDFEPSDLFNGVFTGIVGGALLAKRSAGDSGGGEHKR